MRADEVPYEGGVGTEGAEIQGTVIAAQAPEYALEERGPEVDEAG